MRRTLRPDPKVLARLRRHDLGVLATYGGEHPYASLVSLVLSEDGLDLVFPTDRRTRKYANLRKEPRVSVLLDNRATAASRPARAYALTVLGRAGEVERDQRPTVRARFLARHPRLRRFLDRPGTALVRVRIERVLCVERFQDVQEIVWPTEPGPDPVAGGKLSGSSKP